MIVQIYEIQTPYEAERCIEMGVDHIGSVLLSLSDCRDPVLKETLSLSEGTRTKNSIIPLFNDYDAILKSMDYYRPDFIHFCQSLTDSKGDESDLDEHLLLQKKIREERPEIGVIRSIPIPRRGYNYCLPALKIARLFEPFSDYFLTDTWLGKEPVEGFIGITGIPVDWSLAMELVSQTRVPVILAGGLSPDNVYEGVMEVLPAGADSCTLTNREDRHGTPVRFEKDFKKLKRFVEEVRRAEEDISRNMIRMKKRLAELKEDLAERQAAMPAHSVRPHQLMALEELEEETASLEKVIDRLKNALNS